MFNTSKGRQPMAFTDQDNCLNDYSVFISAANDEHTTLPPFTKLTDNSLLQIHCTEHEIEAIIEVLNPDKASGDAGIRQNAQGCLQICFKTPLYLDK